MVWYVTHEQCDVYTSFLSFCRSERSSSSSEHPRFSRITTATRDVALDWSCRKGFSSSAVSAGLYWQIAWAFLCSSSLQLPRLWSGPHVRAWASCIAFLSPVFAGPRDLVCVILFQLCTVGQAEAQYLQCAKGFAVTSVVVVYILARLRFWPHTTRNHLLARRDLFDIFDAQGLWICLNPQAQNISSVNFRIRAITWWHDLFLIYVVPGIKVQDLGGNHKGGHFLKKCCAEL